MEEDTEVLDWGNEDDELQVSGHEGALQLQKEDLGLHDVRNVGDEDDAVSLGDDEDEEIYPYKSISQEDTAAGPPSTPRASASSQQTTSGKRDIHREGSSGSQRPLSRQDDSPRLQRTLSAGKMFHALPPKPLVAPPPLINPAQTGMARAMVPTRRDRKSNGHGKPASNSQNLSSLPPDWEERLPRSGGRDPYYYNLRTHESTWTRPGAPSSGSASPAKDWENGSVHRSRTKSPQRDFADESRASRRDGKRRVSPGGSLSFDDRHYRPPGHSPLPGPKHNSDRHDMYPELPARPVSPRLSDARRSARSPSPPAYRRDSHSQERAGRPHRERSPLPDRIARRDRSNPQVNPSSTQDRSWITRNMSPPPSTTGRTSDGRTAAPRGRRDRANAEPPSLHIPISQGSRNDTEWSASRPRSPPSHSREVSPPRRYATTSTYSDRDLSPPSRQTSRYDRPESPVQGRTGGYDTYVPVDSIPQRRPRDTDSEYDGDVKRRRTDRSQSPKARVDVHGRPDQDFTAPLNSPPDPYQIFFKRPPLPPQYERFKQAARNPPPAILPLIQPQRLDSEPSVPARGPVSPFADVPSGPRNPAPQSSGRDMVERNSRDRAPRPGGKGRSRFDDPVPKQPTSFGSNDVMDIDPSGPARTLSSGALPKGPRAMDMSKISQQTTSQTPPSMSPVVQAGKPAWQRAPPPHMRQDAPPTMPRSHSSSIQQAPSEPRQSRMPPPTEPRGLDTRESRGPAKATGSNSTPIGDKRPSTGGRAELPTGPGTDRYRDPPVAAIDGRGRYEDDYNRASPLSASYHSASPADRHRNLPAANEPATRWPLRDEPRQQPSGRPSPLSPVVSSRPLPSESERDVQQPPVKERRQSRFSDRERPQTSPTVSTKETREWLTREEAERTGLIGKTPTATNAPLPPTSSGRIRDQHIDHHAPTNGSIEEREPYADRDSAKGRGRRPSVSSTIDHRPSLEGRISSSFEPRSTFNDAPRGRFRREEDDRARTPEPQLLNGDNHEDSAVPLGGVRVHPDRMRLIEPAQATSSGRANPPVKIKRRGRSPERFPPDIRSADEQPAQRRREVDDRGRKLSPPARQGASLLDRLTAPDHDTIKQTPTLTRAPSLRDRVDATPVGAGGIHGLPPRPIDTGLGLDTGEPVPQIGNGTGPGKLQNGAKRRSGKPRKARR